MSLTAIQSNLFDTTVDLQRRHITPDAVGDFTETWNTIVTASPASIQNVRIEESRRYVQGKEYLSDKKAYVPSSISMKPRNGDRLLDKETNILYDIVGVEKYQASRKDIAIGHHYKLYLMEINVIAT